MPSLVTSTPSVDIAILSLLRVHSSLSLLPLMTLLQSVESDVSCDLKQNVNTPVYVLVDLPTQVDFLQLPMETFQEHISIYTGSRPVTCCPLVASVDRKLGKQNKTFTAHFFEHKVTCCLKQYS